MIPTADQIKRAWEKEAKWAEDERIRLVAREEIASLCGLVLGRLNADPREPLAQKLASAFGEALRDFGVTRDEPGAKH